MSDAIRVDVIFEPTGTKKQFDKVSTQAKQAGKKASISFSEGFSKSIKSSMNNVRTQVVGTVGAFFAFNAVKDTLIGAANAAMELEQAITEVNTILPKNTKLTQDQTDALKDFGKQFGTSATAQVKSYYDIVSAGIQGAAAQTKALEAATNSQSVV
jgi:hypothetical protein